MRMFVVAMFTALIVHSTRDGQFPHTLDSNDGFEYQTHGPAQQQHQQLNDYAQPSAATAGATLTGFYPIMTNGTASAAASSFSIDSYGGFTHISNSPSVSPWPEATELAATATTMSVGDSASAAHSHEPTFLYAAGIANVDADLGKFDVATAEEKSGGLATTADTNGSC